MLKNKSQINVIFRKEIAMKILCNNASLCGAVTNVSKAVSERAALKSLEGIKFKLENSMLELTGYDLEIGIKLLYQ